MYTCIYSYYVVCSFMCNCIIYVCCYMYIYIAFQLVASLIGKVMMNHWILEGSSFLMLLTMILLPATGKLGRSNSSASGSPSQISYFLSIGRAASPAAQWQHLRYGRFKFPDGSARPWGDWVTSRRKPVGVPRSTWSRWDSHRMSSAVHSVLGARDVSQGFFRHSQQPNSSHNSPAGDARPRLWSSLFGGWIILPWEVGVRLRHT